MRSRAVEYGGCRLLYRYVSSIVYGRLLTQDVLSQNPQKKITYICICGRYSGLFHVDKICDDFPISAFRHHQSASDLGFGLLGFRGLGLGICYQRLDLQLD